MTAPALPIAEILSFPAVVPLWPHVGRSLGLSASTVYQLAAEDRLPFEVVTLGRRKVCRAVDIHRFLHLIPDEKGAAAEVESATSAEENDDAPGVEPGAPVKRNHSTS
ncbi:helix-turn-helix domain-containing protein [Streptomyces sp. NBC_01775]|uniref:DNA-binding protein n=1 Tax=Streptomyces sp. NBC_01775 TaxID=2975939 RepID=UPI002DDC293B|nr:DNA-binding protein [Streptomyces sp. NBC_01775]WSB78300.1 helix-turn-helix domain-containing protein [Streptomyces sp. NBC_01775]